MDCRPNPPTILSRYLLADPPNIVSRDTIDSLESLFPIDLLPLFISKSVIRNPHLVDPYPRQSGYLCRNFWLESEGIFLQVNFLQNIHLNNLWHVCTSERLRLVDMLERNVRSLLPTVWPNNRIKRGSPPAKGEP